MKKVKKIILWTLLSLLIVVDLVITVYLLNYNKYNVSVFGKNSILIMKEDMENFKKDDLLVVEKNKNEDIKVGDYIFFYDIKSKENLISYGKVSSTYKVNDDETTFTMNDNYPLSSDYVIGKGDTSTVIGGLGLILSVLASRWGFLFLIIIPVAMLFVYQVYLFITEIKKPKRG